MRIHAIKSVSEVSGKAVNHFKEYDYYSILKHFTIGIDVLFVFLLLFNYFNFLPEFWNMIYVFYGVVAVNTCFFAFKINKIPEGERKNI